jgi:hypothetical protein
MLSHRSVALVAALATVAVSAPAARAQQFPNYQSGSLRGSGPFSVSVLASPQANPLDLGNATSATFQNQPAAPASASAPRYTSGTAVVQFATDNRVVTTDGPRSCLTQGVCSRITIVQTTPQTTTTYLLDGVRVTQYQIGSPVQMSIAYRSFNWQTQATTRQQNGTVGQPTTATYNLKANKQQ